MLLSQLVKCIIRLYILYMFNWMLGWDSFQSRGETDIILKNHFHSNELDQKHGNFIDATQIHDKVNC